MNTSRWLVAAEMAQQRQAGAAQEQRRGANATGANAPGATAAGGDGAGRGGEAAGRGGGAAAAGAEAFEEFPAAQWCEANAA